MHNKKKTKLNVKYAKSENWLVKKTKDRPARAWFWNPVYKHGVLVVWGCDDNQMKSEIQHYGNWPRKVIEGISELGQAKFTTNEDSSFIFFRHKRPHPGVIAHEALHFTTWLLDSRGVPVNYENDEAMAYCMEWLVDLIGKAVRGKI